MSEEYNAEKEYNKFVLEKKELTAELEKLYVCLNRVMDLTVDTFWDWSVDNEGKDLADRVLYLPDYLRGCADYIDPEAEGDTSSEEETVTEEEKT